MGTPGHHRRHGTSTSLRVGLAAGAGIAIIALVATVVSLGGSGSSSADAGIRAALTADPPRVPGHDGHEDPHPPLPSETPSAAPSGTPPSKAPSPKRPAAVKRPHQRPRVLTQGTCQASYYGGRSSGGGTTATGEPYDPEALTAANRTLPMGSKVRVTNRHNARSVIVRINDRGPFVPGRCLDLSAAAMKAVGGVGSGVIPVSYEVLPL